MNIIITVAVYEHIRFGYRTVFQQHLAAGIESEGEHVRVSEWMTVAIPALPGDQTAAKVAALDSKAAAIRKDLAALDAARAKLQQRSNDALDVAEPDPYLHSNIDPETLQGAADAANEAAAEDHLLAGGAA